MFFSRPFLTIASGSAGWIGRSRHACWVRARVGTDAIKPKPFNAGDDSEGRIRARNECLTLNTAVRLFSSKGYDGTTIPEIAGTSRLPKANIYCYSATKAAIDERLIAELLGDWDSALGQLDPGLEPRGALSNYVMEKLEF